MKDENYIEYFIYGTFKIVPKKYKPYKIMTISSIDHKNYKSILIGLFVSNI